jgi:hypothetical protein
MALLAFGIDLAGLSAALAGLHGGAIGRAFDLGQVACDWADFAAFRRGWIDPDQRCGAVRAGNMDPSA